jgi:hypothetical protein
MPTIVLVSFCILSGLVGFCLGDMYQLWLQLKELRKEILDSQLKLFELYQLREMLK